MTEKKIVAKVPPHGSLGLLAIGYRGLLAWRKARQEAEQAKADQPNPEK